MAEIVKPRIEQAVDDTLIDLEGIFPNVVEVHKFIDSWNRYKETGIVLFRWVLYSKYDMKVIYQKVLNSLKNLSNLGFQQPQYTFNAAMKMQSEHPEFSKECVVIVVSWKVDLEHARLNKYKLDKYSGGKFIISSSKLGKYDNDGNITIPGFQRDAMACMIRASRGLPVTTKGMTWTCGKESCIQKFYVYNNKGNGKSNLRQFYYDLLDKFHLKGYKVGADLKPGNNLPCVNVLSVAVHYNLWIFKGEVTIACKEEYIEYTL